MEKQDITNILALLKAAYPNSFNGKTADEYKDMARLWYLMFQNENTSEVQAAVVDLIKNRKEGYTPTIGEVQERLRAKQNRYEPGPEEQAMVFKLAAKYEAIEAQERRALASGL